MPNKELFGGRGGLAVADTKNEAGGKAYNLPAAHALAQLTMTGCLSNTFYASGEEQLKTFRKLMQETDSVFLAKLALVAREKGYMKDTPALICAELWARSKTNPTALDALKKVFLRAINNGKMLRNFVQIVRSGQTGRNSFGQAGKKLLRSWFDTHDPDWIFRNSYGNDPTLGDVIKLARPNPRDDEARSQLYRHLIGEKVEDGKELPSLLRQVLEFKETQEAVPAVPHVMLAGMNLKPEHWTQIAQKATWTTLRMNLNSFTRKGVFEDEKLVDAAAKLLQDPEQIARAKVFPYQLLMAYKAVDNEVPRKLVVALIDAMEQATKNVPAVKGMVYICPDVSGSMGSPVTGHRGTATSQVRCVDVAALVAAVLLRRAEQARVMPFDTRLYERRVEPLDTVMTIAKNLASYGGGGTNCSLPLRKLNKEGAKGDLVVYISDNQSWVDSLRPYSPYGSPPYGRGYGRTTGMQAEWQLFKKRNPGARLICHDIAPNRTHQVTEDESKLMIGGFSDAVFEVVAQFAAGELRSTQKFVDFVQAAEL